MSKQGVARSGSRSFQGDRFIPYRGCEEQRMEEFLICNELYGAKPKRKQQEQEQQQQQLQLP